MGLKAKRELKLKMLGSDNLNGGGNSETKSNRLAGQILSYGRYISPQELSFRIDDLNAADIRKCVYEYIHDSELSIVCLGPTHGMVYIEQVRTENFSRRF